MKTIFKGAAVALAALLAVTSLEAAPKNNKSQEKQKSEIVTTKYSADIDCSSCAAKVNRTLTPIKGIKSVDVNLGEKCITVKYDKSKVECDEINQSLNKAGIKSEPCK